MKKLIFLAVCVAGALSAYAQGTIVFANLATGVNAPIDLPDGAGRVPANPNSNIVAELFANGNMIASTQNWAGPGFFNGATVTVDGVGAGTEASFQVRAWDNTSGSDFDSALIRGESNTFSTAVGGNFGTTDPPSTLTGLEGFEMIVVPEPSTIALAVIGAAALLLRRRK